MPNRWPRGSRAAGLIGPRSRPWFLFGLLSWLVLTGQVVGSPQVPQVPEVKIRFLQEYLRILGYEYSLQEVRNIKALHYIHLPLSGSGLSQFKILRGIRSVVLSSGPFFNSHLKALSDFPSLQILSLSGDCRFSPYINDDGMRYLKKLEGLEKLFLVCTSISDKGLEHLSHTRSLRTLGLSQSEHIRGRGFRHLASLPYLDRVYLSDLVISHISLPELVNSLDLKLLSVRNVKFRRCSSSRGTGVTELETLEISESSREAWYPECLIVFSRLKVLTLPEVATDEDLRWLAGMPELEELDFSSAEISGSGLHYLDNTQTLYRVNANCSELDDTAIPYLSRNRKLQELRIYGTKVSDSGLAPLQGHPGIKMLTLPKSERSNPKRLKVLKSLPLLESLEIFAMDPGNIGIDLSGLRNLKQLRIHGNLYPETKESLEASLPGVDIVYMQWLPTGCQ